MPSRSGNELSEDSFGGTENGRTVEARPHGVRLELNDGPIRFEFAKSLQENTAPVKSSPLKRSDGLMNLDVGSRGSPVAKRRSLHGAQDFEMLKHALGGDGACDDRENDHETEPSSFSPSPHRNSSLRKSLSLRKSTLQQRHTPSQPKHQHHEFAVPSVAASASKSRQRFSLDGALSLDTQSFNSPFRRSLPPQSGPLFPQYKGIPHRPSPASKQPHPLANALTPSSSTSSLSDDNQSRNSFPQDAQSPAPQQTRPHLGFSKSLPLGATRPPLFRGGGGSIFSRKVEDGGPAFSTPEAYKMARPLPAAFLSTGLISKKNRNAELSDNGPSISYAMPDTPSKRVSFPPMTTTPFRRSTVADTTSVHHEFGSPSPFSTHARKFSTESFGKGVSTFGTRMNSASLNRKASFTSIDGDDQAQSPTQAIESQSSNDEFPPTPTKASDGRRSKENSLRSSLFGRRTSVNADTFVPPSAVDVPNAQARKSESPVLSISPADYEDVMAWNYEPPSPSITILQNHRSAPMSFAQSRLLRQSRRAVSVPLPSLSIKISPPTPSPLHFTKISYLSAATPTDDKNGSRQTSPHTPQDSFYPPDPSGLSISGKSHAPNPFKLSTSSNTSFPPATPTGHRDNLFPFGNTQNAAVTCVLNNDVDTSLTARFGTVVVYGVGEFSQVYRVENPLASAVEGPARSFSYFGRVWAVKKTKRPFTGLKDKEQKIREVKILKALRGHDHVIQFTDAWEAKGHLYIQTEFCENGNLKDFLTQTGFKARLDDFRIWKILLELSLGVKHIHDNNFIHLDLKPANVFIDWEGVLKIGDFGLASAWPAPPDIDGEGDREYIGPEILHGRYDKPADIFALGMIMLEIAGNIILPDNGTSWQRLRVGDMSDLPSLTFSSESTLPRDESGNPVHEPPNRSRETLCGSDGEDSTFKLTRDTSPTPQRIEELVEPPNFMINPDDSEALDKIVQWMISPIPDARPVVDRVYQLSAVQWVERRRRAGATVYEGNYGPADDVLNHDRDVDMTDAI